MNLKISRLESNIKKELTIILKRISNDENLKEISITDCQLASDLSQAKVYYFSSDETKKKELAKSLDKAKGFLRTELSKKLDTRHTPELKFIYDKSIENAQKIEAKLEELSKK